LDEIGSRGHPPTPVTRRREYTDYQLVSHLLPSWTMAETHENITTEHMGGMKAERMLEHLK
jgi:hypothetical protein